MEATRIRLAEGVHLTYLPARKFKTSLLSAQFVTPLRRETAGANALLAAVLRRGTVSCPDMGALSAKMDNLYDASIDYTVRKKGENQCVGFVASFIDDRYAPGGERLLEPAAALLGELICDPVTYHGRFVPEYFESEKTNLLEAIRSLINDKRDWADSRLLRALCDGEAYAVPRLGDEETVDKLEASAGAEGTFLDDIIMHEVLSELRDIAQRGGVSCTCGSREWKLQVNFSSVDLSCAQCGAALRIPAATADDLEDLCCKNTLVIRGRSGN